MRSQFLYQYYKFASLVHNIKMERIIREEKRREKKEAKFFYCLCDPLNRRFTNGAALRKHVVTKHADERAKYDAHVTFLETKFNQKKIEFSQNLQTFGLQQIGVNHQDLAKFSLVDKTWQKLREMFKNEGLVNIHQEDEFDNYEDDVEGGLNNRDINIMGEVQELKENFGLEEPFANCSDFPQLESHRSSCRIGKVICMKKELSQIYCMEWAALMHLQLQLFALQVWSKLQNHELAQIEECQNNMWGDRYQIIPILKEYYEEVLQNHLNSS